MPIEHIKKAFSRAISKKTSTKKPKTKSVGLPKDDESIVVEISLWSATRIILIILLLLLIQNIIVEIKDVLIILFFALFIAAAFNPGVDYLERKAKFPRAAGIVFLYILVFGFLIGLITGIVPIITEQLTEIALSLNDYLNNFLHDDVKDGFLATLKVKLETVMNEMDQRAVIQYIQESIGTLTNNLSNFASNALGVLSSVVDGIFNMIIIILLSFFMVVERDAIKDFFTTLFPVKYEKYIQAKTHSIQVKIGEWVHGQMALFLIVGGIAYVGLVIIGVKYALTLALVAGIAEFLPYIGPIIAFATAAPVAFNDSLVTGFWVIGFYSALQIFEGNIIIPWVMKKAIGLSPIVTILAMLIGWQFLGIVGMIIAIPLASIMSLFIDDFRGKRK